ncbi:MAG TPA: hypothetical protein VM287_13965 [Egibacteraceae bacterium]|jgi:hypothetical protein|nr:hypothetical protein [Egibacteraceae bacterium]
MFVSDLRHFLDIPDNAPGPARKMAEHLGFVVRAASAGEAGVPWVSAVPCRRRPGHRPCEGHIAVFRAHLPAPIEWRCSACGDEGVVSGWEGSPFDLRQPRSHSNDAPQREIALADPSAATLRDLRLLDTDCERLVFSMRSSGQGIVMVASADDLEELVGYVAAEANHETNRRRQKRLDDAFSVLSDALTAMDSGVAAPTAVKAAGGSAMIRRNADGLTGRWRIIEMELWGREDLELVAPAFIAFQPDGTGSFGFIVVNGSIDWRSDGIDHGRVEFSWDGSDEGDPVSGRGWAALEDGGFLGGRIYFHLGDDSGFRAERWVRDGPDQV